MTEVVAALIWQGDKFMICQRPAHKTRGLLWEFDRAKGKDVVTYLYDVVMENELPDYLQYDFGLTK